MCNGLWNQQDNHEKTIVCSLTHVGVIRVAPHQWLPLFWSDPNHGHAPSFASKPFTTLLCCTLVRPHLKSPGKGGGGVPVVIKLVYIRTS